MQLHFVSNVNTLASTLFLSVKLYSRSTFDPNEYMTDSILYGNLN